MRTLNKNEIDYLKQRLKDLNKSKLSTAIYARKSAEDERQTSLDTQIAQCRSLIQGYDFLKEEYVFSEDNVSGMFTSRRDEYLKMLDLVKKRKIDVVVVMKLDRLSRDISDALYAMKLFNAFSCYYIAGDDIADSQTASGEFLRNIQLSQNQYHARRTACDVMAVECRNVEKGLSAGGTAPYGLKTVAKRYEINEDEAPAIRLMFEGIAKGHSYKMIIDELTSLGYRTRKGDKFCFSTLNCILRNEKYYGTYIYNRKNGKRRKERVLIDSFDEIRNEKDIPPIITKELFDNVQNILAKRKVTNAKQNKNPDFILTDLLICKNCNCSLCGTTQTCGRNKTKRRIYSHTKKQRQECSTPSISSEYLEKAIKSQVLLCVNEYLKSQNTSKEFFKPLEKELSAKCSSLKRYVTDIKNQVSNFLKKASDPKTSAILSKEYEKKAEEYLITQSEKEADLNKLEKDISTLNALSADFSSAPKLSEEELFPTPQKTREIIRIFIKQIIIDHENDSIEIVFH